MTKIFVVLAFCRGVCMFLPYKICPVAASSMIAEAAVRGVNAVGV